MSFFNIDALTGSKANDKLEKSAAANKLQLLQGVEGLWIKARRDNVWYIINKLVSITIALSFGYITLSFKGTTQDYLIQYQKKNGGSGDGSTSKLEGMSEAQHILIIYWFLFIYLCMSGMDEMIELFSVLN